MECIFYLVNRKPIIYREELSRVVIESPIGKVQARTLALRTPGTFKRFPAGDRIQVRKFLEETQSYSKEEALESVSMIENLRKKQFAKERYKTYNLTQPELRLVVS